MSPYLGVSNYLDSARIVTPRGAGTQGRVYDIGQKYRSRRRLGR